jgi:hypothetical protein
MIYDNNGRVVTEKKYSRDNYLTGDPNYHEFNTYTQIGYDAPCAKSEVNFTFLQSTNDHWIKVVTPQAYADGNAGGTASFKLSWFGYHAAGSSMAKWDAVFGNHHGRDFIWAKSPVQMISAIDSYYQYTPSVTFWKQNATGNGTSDSNVWMRWLWIKVSGNAGSQVCARRCLEISGISGGWGMRYTVENHGSSTPAGIAQL